MFKTKIEEFDFSYSYMVAEKICENLGMWKKKILGLMIYILHVQDLCELRERPIPLLDLVSLAFLCYFLFREERDIKFEQKYLFTPDFNRGGLRKTNGTYHRWVK